MPSGVNRFFFFNPFSIEILTGTIKKVLQSHYGLQDPALLFFYYPQNAYIAYLSAHDALSFYDEIDCTDLFAEHDDRNRIMIFELP